MARTTKKARKTWVANATQLKEIHKRLQDLASHLLAADPADLIPMVSGSRPPIERARLIDGESAGGCGRFTTTDIGNLLDAVAADLEETIGHDVARAAKAGKKR